MVRGRCSPQRPARHPVDHSDIDHPATESQVAWRIEAGPVRQDFARGRKRPDAVIHPVADIQLARVLDLAKVLHRLMTCQLMCGDLVIERLCLTDGDLNDRAQFIDAASLSFFPELGSIGLQVLTCRSSAVSGFGRNIQTRP